MNVHQNSANNAQGVSQLPGEEQRGMPSVNDTGPSSAKRGLIVIVLLLLLMIIFGLGYWKYQKVAAKANEAAEQKKLRLTSAVPARTFSEPPPLPQPEIRQPIPIVPPPPPGLPTATNNKPVTPLDKSGSSLMAGTNKTDTGGNRSVSPAGNGEGVGSGGMAEILTATHTPSRKAGMLGNRNFILAKGSSINCALQTRLDSTIPGMTACIVTRDIFSDNGKILLVERGTTVSGEYKSNMRQGMARIFVLWSRIKTPNGVIINLDSPGTDPLGGAGVPGYIDNHFWQRFGGALMLSLVDDVVGNLSANTSNGNNQFNFNGTSDAAQSMAAEVLKSTINIPPTLYKNQGEQVSIYIARDLDFSSVYDLHVQ